MHNTSHTWLKTRIITWILVLHQSTQIMECSEFKHSESDTKDDTRWYKGPHQALRCKVLDSPSELRPQLTSQSSGGLPLGHTNLPQHPQYSGKAWASKAQQDWPINVDINSRLLTCQALGKLYTNAKPTLWERPYFQSFRSIQHLEERFTLL
jgi:hypothetical protein